MIAHLVLKQSFTQLSHCSDAVVNTLRHKYAAETENIWYELYEEIK
jgi:hypothetical protein